MTEDEQVGTGPRRPWVTPAMVEEDCAATESGSWDYWPYSDGASGYASGS